jgi:hypothetical protein
VAGICSRFDPAIVDNEPDKQQLIDWDLRLAVRFLRTKSLVPPIGTYRWVPGFSEITHAINCRWEATGKPVEVSLDTETLGLYPWYPDKQIVSIGFTLEAGRADCLYLGPFDDPEFPLEPDLFAQIEWLLTSPRIRLRGSNLKYSSTRRWSCCRTSFRCSRPTPLPGMRSHHAPSMRSRRAGRDTRPRRAGHRSRSVAAA